MRILVIGGTRGTGREVVKQALARGHDVVALARNPSKITTHHERLRVVRGDVMDPVSVEAAVQGCGAVVCALGHKRWLGPSKILSEGTRNVVRAMEKHGVKRLVVETALGVGDSAGRLGVYYTLFTIPFILPFYWYDKGRQERVGRDSSLEWVIVRPGQLTNGRERGLQARRAGETIRSVSISRADVADFMLNQLGETPYLRQAPGVCDRVPFAAISRGHQAGRQRAVFVSHARVMARQTQRQSPGPAAASHILCPRSSPTGVRVPRTRSVPG
jgi:putative NADH-flavin reductase